MPLLLVSGYPSSGKSTIAKRLKQLLAEKITHDVIIVSDDTVNSEFSRDAEHYLDKCRHATHNNMLRSEVRRALAANAETLVIVDSLNYARSHRYEMCTAANNCRTKFAIVHVSTDATTSERFNVDRPKDERYAADVFADIVARYENVRPHLNGERPLFTIAIASSTEDVQDEAQMPRQIELPIDELHETLFMTNKSFTPRTILATTASQKSSCNVVYEINKQTHNVIEQIIRAQSTAGIGGTVLVDDNIKYAVRKMHTFASLARVRARFLEMARQGLVPADETMNRRFVEYVESVSL